jgi:hypothetical protein
MDDGNTGMEMPEEEEKSGVNPRRPREAGGGGGGGRMRLDFWTKARIAALASVITIGAIFVASILWKNWAPFGAEVSYEIEVGEPSDYATTPAPLTGSALAGNDENGMLYQVEELVMSTEQVRFTLKTPYESLKRLTLEVEYGGDPDELLVATINPADNQLIAKPLHNKSLNGLEWSAVSSDTTTLFQREVVYPDAVSFIESFYSGNDMAFGEPGNQVASYYYQLEPDYPSIDPGHINAGTYINHSFRGKHVMKIYIKDEPLSLAFDWHDLNWYEGPDPLSVYVYNPDSAMIYAETLIDDGDITPSSIASDMRHFELSLPDLVEGEYKVDISCGSDIVFSGIRSNQGYLDFYEEVFIADNALYGLTETKSCTVYTNGKRLSAKTWHPDAVQTIDVNGVETLNIAQDNVTYSIAMDDDINRITTQNGDITLSSPGAYFSFTEESLFYPISALPYSRLLPLSDINYIIAGYIIPAREGETWKQTVVFDMAGVEIRDQSIELILIAPGLATGGPITLNRITAIAEK